MTTTRETLVLQLADAYANASFEQGLNQRTDDPAPENAREKLAAEVRRLAEVEAEFVEMAPDHKQLRKEVKLLEHKVITCGVAASHPDAALTLRADYMKWDSPQAQEVRKLRAERDQLCAEVEALRADSFESVIQGLAATLPDDGSSITIYVEHWAGSVTATDWDGNEMEEHDADTVLDRVRYASRWLDEQQSKLKQGEAESKG